MIDEFTKWQKHIESELRALKVARSGVTPGGSSIAYNGSVEFQKNGQALNTFYANQSSNIVVNYTVPTDTSDLNNDSGFITSSAVGTGTLTIQKNGSTVQTFGANSSSDATANITVPTSNSELTNGAGYQTAQNVADAIATSLANYYTKSETYTQAEIDSMVSAIPKFAIEVVQTLPTTDISSTTVYLVPNSGTEASNLYTEWIYVANAWEKLGEQRVDLSNYTTFSDVSSAITTALASYTTTAQLTQLLAAKANSADLATVATSGSYNDLSDKPSMPFLPLAGGNMTGNIGYTGSNSTYQIIKFYNNTADSLGQGVGIGGGGIALFGGGESVDIVKTGTGYGGGEEKTIISSDYGVDFYTNQQGGYSADNSHLSSITGNIFSGRSKALDLSPRLWWTTTKSWAKVATITGFTTQGTFATIHCYYGAGNNGDAAQNNKLEIILQRGYHGESTTKQVGVLALAYNPIRTGNRSILPKVKVISEDNTDFDVWVYTDWTYCGTNTTVEVSDSANFVIGSTIQTTEPTGTYVQESVVIKNLYNAFVEYSTDVTSSTINSIKEPGSYRFNGTLSEVFGANSWGILFVLRQMNWVTQFAIRNYATNDGYAQIYVRNSPNNLSSWEQWRPIWTTDATSAAAGFMSAADKTKLDGIDASGTVLFSGSTYDNINLTDSIDNYTRVKIHYGDGGYGYKTAEIDLSIGRVARLDLSYINTSGFFQRTALLTFSGTAVTMTQQAGVLTNYGSTMVYQPGYKVYVQKIVGYTD